VQLSGAGADSGCKVDLDEAVFGYKGRFISYFKFDDLMLFGTVEVCKNIKKPLRFERGVLTVTPGRVTSSESAEATVQPCRMLEALLLEERNLEKSRSDCLSSELRRAQPCAIAISSKPLSTDQCPRRRC
jgi:hypothetical protein